MPSFNDIKGENTFDNGVPFEYTQPAKQSNLFSKVFGVMFISLLLSALVSYGFAYWFASAINSGNDSLAVQLIYVMYAAAFGVLVMALILPRVFARGRHSILPSYIIYCLLFSVIISVLFVCYDLEILSITFAVTSGIFGIMAVLGALFKGNIKSINVVIVGLFLGALALALINVFRQSDEISWIVSFVVFAAILFVTISDVAMVKNILQNGYANNSNNLVIYCSFLLYTDFINIFIRLVYYLAILSSKKK